MMICPRVLVVMGLVACQSSSPPPTSPAKPPTITDLQPDNATARGLRLAYIVGTNFNQRAPVTVYYGPIKSPRAVVVSPTKIQAEVPAGTPSTDVEVRVQQDGFEPAVAPLRFRYLPEAPH
jgi:hypothetical protein